MRDEIMTNGQIQTWDEATYRAYPALNFSNLKLMEVSPLACKADAEGHKGPPTKPMIESTHTHTATLEPGRLEDEVVIWRGGFTKTGKPTTSKNSTAYKEFVVEVESAGGFVLEQADLDRYRAIAKAVHAHPFAGKYLRDGVAELPILWEHPFGVQCKSRLDYMGQHLVGLKTTVDVGSKFQKQLERYFYHAQCAFYQDAFEAMTGERRDFVIVSVERTYPYDVGVDVMDDDLLALGRRQYEGWLKTWMQCTESGVWPGKCPGERKAMGSDYIWAAYGQEIAA